METAEPKSQKPTNHRTAKKNRVPILYHNSSKTAVLLDLPESIASAQASPLDREPPRLVSSEALETQFQSPEPKSTAARRKVEQQFSSLVSSDLYEQLIAQALAEIRNAYDGPWCLPRCVASKTSRKIRSATITASSDAPSEGLDSWIDKEPAISSSRPCSAPCLLELPLAPESLSLPNLDSLDNAVLHNPHSSSSRINVTTLAASYVVPPGSTAIPTLLSPSTAPLTSLALQACPALLNGQFDLILLDPPWSNRSARRAASYRHASRAQDPFCGIAEVLVHHMAPEGYVACWVTHTHDTRNRVEALLGDLGMRIVEEWIWAKVTRQGEPVVPLGSQWRRGWELLIVARQQEYSESQENQAVQRRVIAGVPDVHSRKPCLKELFEQELLPRNARVAEVFARHLVAGWTSIGEEVLRFNWEGCWRWGSEDE